VSVKIGMSWMKEHFCVMIELLEKVLILLCKTVECSHRQCPTDGFNCQVASTRH